MDWVNADNISALSSFILVIATVVYVFFTMKLFSETKKLREVETTPFIFLELSPFRSSNHLGLKIRNIGKSPGYNVEFEIDDKYKDLFQFNFDNTIGYLSPNQELESFGKQYSEFTDLNVDNFLVTVKYYSKDRTFYKEDFNLEWKSLSGLILDDNLLGKIENNLQKISKSLENQTKVLKENKHISRIAILEIEKIDFYFKCLFNDGFYGKIQKSKVNLLGLSDLEKVCLLGTNLYESNTRLTFNAEEIYNKFKNLENKEIKYKKKLC